MLEFKTIKVRDLGKVVTGNTPPTKERVYYGDKHIFIKPTDMVAGERYVFETEEYYSDLAAEKYKKALIPPFSTCVVTIGSLGRKLCLTCVPCFTNQAVNAVIPSDDYDKFFVYYLFKYINPAIENLSNGTASGRDNVSKGSLENLNIVVPKSKECQRRIASILSAYDELIEVNSQRIRLLEDTARELYKEWFVRLRFPGYKEAKFVKGVPEGWEVKKLDEISEVTSSKRIFLSDYVFEGIPFYRGKEISLKSKNEALSDILFISRQKFEEINKKFGAPKSGDILITAVGTIGNIYLVNESDGEFYFKDGNLIWIRNGSDSSLSMYLYCYFIGEAFSNALSSITIGSSQEALTIASVKKISLIIPAKELISIFHNTVNPIRKQIETLQQQSAQLRQIRDRLLPRLISGKLQLKEDAPAKSTTIIDLTQHAMRAEEAPGYGTSKAPNPLFTRRVLAAYIIDKLHTESTFGHVKLMKLMYLCEHLAHIETAAHYHRDAAGPYDNQMIRSINSQLKKAGWFEAVKQGTDKFASYKYFPLAKKDEYKLWFRKYYSDKQEGIDRLIAVFGTKVTEKVEMVATLYEAWRYLKEGSSLPHPGDDAIVREVLKNWHVSKDRIPEDNWRKCLVWMREEQGWVT